MELKSTYTSCKLQLYNVDMVSKLKGDIANEQ